MFVLYARAEPSDAEAEDVIHFDEYDLGPKHSYGRLTIDPGTWFGFKGGEDGGLVLNLSDIVHSPDEADGKDSTNSPTSGDQTSTVNYASFGQVR